MKEKRIYISGKITDLEPISTADLFRNTALKLLENNYQPFDPLLQIEAQGMENEPYDTIMRHVLIHMLQCDALLMLHNWQDSKGAIIERELALKLNMPVFYSINEIKF